MPSLRPLQRELLKSLHVELAPEGYGVRAQQLERTTTWGRYILQLAFIEYETVFEVVVYVSVRHDAVEDLVNASNPLLKERERSETATIGCEIGTLLGKGQVSWAISHMDQIPGVVRDVIAKFREAGVPFFERFTAADEVYRVFAKDDREAQFYSPFAGTRGMRAVALAFQLGRKGDIPQLVRAKSPIIKRGDDRPNRDRFLKLADSLRT